MQTIPRPQSIAFTPMIADRDPRQRHIAHLSRRFGLSLPTAGVIADLAFAARGRR